MWLAEHHFQHEGYECLPNILMLAVHLAHITEQLRIGCGFNIAPMWHPLRLVRTLPSFGCKALNSLAAGGVGLSTR